MCIRDSSQTAGSEPPERGFPCPTTARWSQFDAFKNNYSSAEMNKMVEAQRGETDATKRAEIIGQIQDLTAKDVPLIPSWNGKNVAVANKDVKGVKETLDPTYIFRLWAISKAA